MKPSALLLSVLCVGLTGPLSAAEAFRLEPVLYVFRDTDFTQVQLNAATLAPEGHGASFTSPAKLSFDGHTLELGGAHYSWDGAGEPAPAPFSPVSVPAMVVRAAQQASVYCAAPMQYMEKSAVGGLQVRQLGREAPDVPHYQLTFDVRPVTDANRVAVACQFQLVLMVGREKIPGVELDVGRPILRRLEENFSFVSRTGEWSGIVLRQPGGSDFGLLLLLKVGAAPETAATVVAPPPASGPMTADQLDEFATFYYRRPRPELIPAAIEALGPSGFLTPGMGPPRPNGRFWTFVGFFAEVFAANPARVEEWQKLAKKQDWLTRDCLQAAVKFSQPGAILAVDGPWIFRHGSIFSLGDAWGSANDARWGAFFASGNTAYVLKLAAQLRDIDPLHSDGPAVAVMWSLARQSLAHPLVRTTLEAARADADPRTRVLLDDLLTKDLAAIQQEVTDLAPPNFFFTPYLNNLGTREAGDYSPVSPGQEIHPK